MMRRLTTILALALATLTLSACVTIPTSGPVAVGEVDTQDAQEGSVFTPQGPKDGSTQDQILLGFLGAGVAPRDDFAIAREFLTPEMQARWDPRSSVTIRAEAIESTRVSERVLEASVLASQQVSVDGSMTQQEGTRNRLSFEFELVDGEWRISAAPDGIVLTPFYFGQLYRETVLQWYSVTEDTLVPEVRWFERSGEDMPSQVIDALLQGPSAWLAPTVRLQTRFGMSLVAPPTVRSNGVLDVRLTAPQIGEIPRGEIERFALQVARSLDLPATPVVSVSLEGSSSFTVSSENAGELRDTAADTRPLITSEGSFQYIGTGEPLLFDYGPTLVEEEAESFAMLRDGTGGIARAGETAFWIDGASMETVPLPVLPVLIEPSLDSSGWVWMMQGEDLTKARLWRAGQFVTLDLPEQQGERITAMEVSRDGTRLAIASTNGTESYVQIASITRNGSGVPTRVNTPLQLPELQGEITHLTWASSTSVVAVFAGVSGVEAAELVVGGRVEALAPPGSPIAQLVGASSVTAGVESLRMVTNDGRLFSYRQERWILVTTPSPVQLLASQV
ncbi:LpqB family beta-propeller domain-containing protein [Humidisolicoccus flavus]|uniref:LpqB family beta-propeller domain-containing protein n=1 Tax=Humidisolicoccus flavus TaxID=3111414 RepID=UPI0032443CF9